MAEIKVKMSIDPFKVVQKALEKVEKPEFPSKIVALNYDEEADVLYVKFKHAKIIDNSPLDDKGLVLASLNEQREIVGLIIIEASKLA